MLKSSPSLFVLMYGLSVLFFSTQAYANANSSVGSAKVEKGKSALEYRLAGSIDGDDASQDERVRSRLHIDHGFTDYYAARLVFSVDRRQGNNLEFANVRLENRFYLFKQQEHGFDGGFRLLYTHADGDKKPNSAGVRFYQAVKSGSFETRFNQNFEHQIGEDSDPGLSLELRSQVTYELRENFRLGVDMFNDFGNLREQSGYSAHEHAIGPVIKTKIGAYSLETAYRTGISSASADHSLTFIVSRGW